MNFTPFKEEMKMRPGPRDVISFLKIAFCEKSKTTKIIIGSYPHNTIIILNPLTSKIEATLKFTKKESSANHIKNLISNAFILASK